MITLIKTHDVLNQSKVHLFHEDPVKKIIIFKRADLIFIFNFHPFCSFADYQFEAPLGKYEMVLDCDAPKYGGHSRLYPKQIHFTLVNGSGDRSHNMLSLYLPARSAFVLCLAIEELQPGNFLKKIK